MAEPIPGIAEQSDPPAPADLALAGPIFVAGRQHSGNTVMAVMLGRVPGCHAQIDENAFFEMHTVIDRVRDPEERAKRVVEEMKLEDESLASFLPQRVVEWARENPGAPALRIYKAATAMALEHVGKRVWVQKATSYIFYGEEILSSVPGSRLIYMLRNPYDISASRKRRDASRERLWSTVGGWNKGLRIARRLAERLPDRFRIVRYEDLTTEPEKTARDLLSFLGLPFDPACLDVPHVNRSETKYSLTGDGKGLNRSRVYYYRDNLDGADMAALDMVVTGLVDTYYPDLPHRGRSFGAAAKARGLLRLAGGVGRYAWMYATRIRRTPLHLIKRTIRRLT